MAHFGTLNMLLDSIPKRIKKDPDFVKTLNCGSIGNSKSQNIPGIQSLLDMCKNIHQTKDESR